jgi:hypothetical protein
VEVKGLVALERLTLAHGRVAIDSRKFTRKGAVRGLLRRVRILLCSEPRLPIAARSFLCPVR